MATIMTTSEKAIIIEPDWARIKEVKMKLGKLKKRKIIIVNIHNIARQFLNNESILIEKLKELINSPNYLNYLKIFHDCTKEDFNGMLLAFSLHGRDDLKYIGGELKERNIADSYKEYVFKDFHSNSLISKKEGSYKEEL
mgnify:FL=1